MKFKNSLIPGVAVLCLLAGFSSTTHANLSGDYKVGKIFLTDYDENEDSSGNRIYQSPRRTSPPPPGYEQSPRVNQPPHRPVPPRR